MNAVRTFPDPEAFRWREIASGFTRPLDLQHAGDERIFVVEQRGLIWILSEGNVLPEPFLDIRDRVNDGANEQGLLGLAFHPAYSENGHFFLNYTQADDSTVIARFSTSEDPNRADPASEVRILSFDQPYRNHNGGGLAFGLDGRLYIGTGDGGSANDPQENGQNLNSLLGKLLRLDVDSEQPYAIPEDNPLLGAGARAEIWAYGLRNPFRFSFDSANGDLYIGDVGQNAWEEIDFQPGTSSGGENYGWNIREGAHPFAGQQTEGLTDPVAEYGHNQGCSVTGGYVVRNTELPEWNGVYLYGDYCTGLVWGLLRAEDGTWQNQLLFETGLNISSFGLDSDGNVYIVDHGGGIFRLESKS
jgi:glucose/arabinose dehydrogenase